MSASIYWKPQSTVEHQIDVAAPSDFIEIMTKVFGNYPWWLGPHHSDVLRALAVTCDDGAEKNPYTAILEAIHAIHGSQVISVWPEY